MLTHTKNPWKDKSILTHYCKLELDFVLKRQRNFFFCAEKTNTLRVSFRAAFESKNYKEKNEHHHQQQKTYQVRSSYFWGKVKRLSNGSTVATANLK